ncbi:hypothetical protein H5410_035125 [Solanum commersonii]|uniref:Uncharacterized protein n=1 Tax=Solanum commersonii TaxID=4109 RepID=A0A9J5Y119_SOLCO|nr:hypothetical protein H5410_035125 [Solanum commersonii]
MGFPTSLTRSSRNSNSCLNNEYRTSSSDGIARIHGLDEVMASELVEFEVGTIGIAQFGIK